MMVAGDRVRMPCSAWVLSLGLHVVIVGLALIITAQVQPILNEEVFRWDIALVRSSTDSPQPEASQSTPAAVRTVQTVQPVPPVEPTSDMVMTRVAPQYSPEIVHPMVIPPKPEPVQEIVQAKAPPVQPQEMKKEEIKEEAKRQAPDVVKAEPLPQIVQAKVPSVEPQEAAKQEVTKEAVMPHDVVQPEAAVRELRSAPVAKQVAPPVEANLSAHTYVPPVPSHLQQAETTEVASQSSPSSEEKAPEWQSLVPVREESAKTATGPVAAPSAPAVAESTAVAAAPVQAQSPAPLVAKAAPVRPASKVDNAWLAESLGRRIREVTRYPSAARLNGTEGKVVLRVVLRADGHLADVTVHRSSGHDVLDRAAIETIKLACPIQMKQALSAPEVAVYVPIVYSLEG